MTSISKSVRSAGVLFAMASIAFGAQAKKDLAPGAHGPSATAGVSTPSLQKGPGPEAAVDTFEVRRLYSDGDFDEALAVLEKGLKQKAPATRAESTFVHKHLGVMYLAQYQTREKGKWHLRQMLETDSSAQITDMYASDMVYMIFKNILDEFEAKRHTARPRDTLNLDRRAGTGKDTLPKPKVAEPRRKGNGLLWWGAAAATVGAGVAAYYVLTLDESGTEFPVD
jgi:hypothetical protein